MELLDHPPYRPDLAPIVFFSLRIKNRCTWSTIFDTRRSNWCKIRPCIKATIDEYTCGVQSFCNGRLFCYRNFLIKISRLIVIELFYFYPEYFYNETTKSISISFSSRCVSFRSIFSLVFFVSMWKSEETRSTCTRWKPPSEFGIPSN